MPNKLSIRVDEQNDIDNLAPVSIICSKGQIYKLKLPNVPILVAFVWSKGFCVRIEDF